MIVSLKAVQSGYHILIYNKMSLELNIQTPILHIYRSQTLLQIYHYILIIYRQSNGITHGVIIPSFDVQLTQYGWLGNGNSITVKYLLYVYSVDIKNKLLSCANSHKFVFFYLIWTPTDKSGRFD